MCAENEEKDGATASCVIVPPSITVRRPCFARATQIPATFLTQGPSPYDEPAGRSPYYLIVHQVDKVFAVTHHGHLGSICHNHCQP